MIFTGYFLLIASINFYWNKIDFRKILSDGPPEIPVSVIIPARNEAPNIQRVLNAVLSQSYPADLYEIIVIDDHSTDHTAMIVKQFKDRVKLIELHQEPEIMRSKKHALTVGIREAKYEIIVTLDADCIPVSGNWLETVVGYLVRKDLAGLTGPVSYQTDGSFLQDFQALENAGMMVVTGAGYQSRWFEMANGANMCFLKQAFNSVNGYEGNEQFASGDDMFLFEKFRKKYPDRIGFIADKDAAVRTLPMVRFKNLIQQRVRWGTKNSRMENPKLKLCLAFVFIINLLTLLMMLYLIIAKPLQQAMILILLVFKSLTDYRILIKGTTFLDQKFVMRSFLPNIFLYPVVLVFTGILSLLRSDYNWKGRKIR